MNTYTEQEIQLALDTLATVFEDDQKYKEMPDLAKELFACALLRSHDLIRSN